MAGMAIPSATPYSVNVGYLGVVPEFRRGYVDEVLGEITRIHAGNGESRITATTDLGNAPMAAAFRRGRVSQHGDPDQSLQRRSGPERLADTRERAHLTAIFLAFLVSRPGS
ncbi:hypothetical protein GCM10020220_067420 [Nonomuraea rubra]